MNSKQNPHFRSSREDAPLDEPELVALDPLELEPLDPPFDEGILDSLEAAEGESGTVTLSMSRSSLFGGHVLGLPLAGMPSPAAQPQYVA